MLSSIAVYVDADGNHVNSDLPPRFAGPIREDQPTAPPGSMDYNSRDGYGPNEVAAERVLLDDWFAPASFDYGVEDTFLDKNWCRS